MTSRAAFALLLCPLLAASALAQGGGLPLDAALKAAQAEQAAADAVRTGRPTALDSMSANERKVVHEYLKDR
ncbi:MAG TPA: R3H domain-containing nucleic acid-binding protein, partial [Sphingomicrobium sp.]|nr:R3H domain-containing nucleic acid-binding protein [Sphingomicrobium sp.]